MKKEFIVGRLVFLLIAVVDCFCWFLIWKVEGWKKIIEKVETMNNLKQKLISVVKMKNEQTKLFWKTNWLEKIYDNQNFEILNSKIDWKLKKSFKILENKFDSKKWKWKRWTLGPQMIHYLSCNILKNNVKMKKGFDWIENRKFKK